MNPISPRLRRAFLRTRYEVAGIGLWIGQRSPPADALLRCHAARTGIFVTAWNPRSHRMPAGWNRRMQARLLERLVRVPVLPASGSWRSWHEEHVLVLARLAFVARLARRFRQRAVVIVRVGQAVRLAFI